MVNARMVRRLAAPGVAAAALLLAQIFAASGAFAFSASFAWCPEGSPNFQLADVPQGTTTLQFAMTDLDKPGFHHGGGTVGYRGQPEVPCDAFASGFIHCSSRTADPIAAQIPDCAIARDLTVVTIVTSLRIESRIQAPPSQGTKASRRAEP